MTLESVKGVYPAIVFSLLIGTLGCGEETLDLTPMMSSPTMDSGVADVGDSPTSDMDMGDIPAPTLYPDEARFESEVVPILLRHCGAGCHQNSVILDNNNIANGNQFEFDDSDIPASIEEFLHPAYSNLEDPGNSEVIVHHNGNAFGELRDPAERRAVADWIADALIPKGDGPNPMGTSGASCSHLPRGDGIGPEGWFQEFETQINPMFVGTPELPEGFCSGSGCHTIVDAGGSLNLLPISDPCSARWNFFVSQSFIDLTNLSNSSLLRKPLGEPSIDPDILTHGGRQVFIGQDDNYILLRNWITDINDL